VVGDDEEEEVTKGVAKAVERYEKAMAHLENARNEFGELEMRTSWAYSAAHEAAHTLAGLVARHVKKVSK
jgi:hypothetical protein